MKLEEADSKGGRLARWSLVCMPILAVAFVFLVDLKPGEPHVTRTAAVALVMAVWWITGALPLAATSLLPLVLFPLLGIMQAKDVSELYLTDVTFLFMGGFLVALAMERWDLHRRMALWMMLGFGVRPRYAPARVPRADLFHHHVDHQLRRYDDDAAHRHLHRSLTRGSGRSIEPFVATPQVCSSALRTVPVLAERPR
jgi:hypothetical protein